MNKDVKAAPRPLDTSSRADDLHGEYENEALYPHLSDDQIARIEQSATCRVFRAGEMLFDQGLRDAPVYFLRSGKIDFYDRRPERDQHFLTIDRPTFIGDLSMFTGEPTVAACVAAKDTKVTIVPHDEVRTLVQRHSDIGDIMLRTFMARRQWLTDHDAGRLTLIGLPRDRETYRLQEFLDRNQIPVRLLDPEEDKETAALLGRLDVERGELPVLICSNHVSRRPDVEEVAKNVGLRPTLSHGRDEPYDTVVIGAGPAGLAATVYAASEGLRTLCIDADSPGGQAATSSKIENYLGFATGVSGEDLAKQAVLQARKFRATLCNPCTVQNLECDDPADGSGTGLRKLTLADGSAVFARSVVLATGAKYRTLDADRCEDFEGRGVYYAAGHIEAQRCGGRPVAVVGAGNSAGQAAIFLARHAECVKLVVRGGDLGKSMSDYLTQRIEQAENIDVLLETKITALHGDDIDDLAEVTLSTGETIPCRAVFVMIGAEPNSTWLRDGDCVGLCPKGFVKTGPLAASHPHARGQYEDRPPFLLETTRPGVFAVGDVRAGSVKRVASGVGEGSMSVAYIHQYLAGQTPQ